MEPIDEQHVAEPGLIVIDVTAADEATARAAVDEMDSRWATSRPDRIRRLPGQAGVTLRLYADIRRSAPPPDGDI